MFPPGFHWQNSGYLRWRSRFARVPENVVNWQQAQVVKHDFELVELGLEKLPEEYEFQEATGAKQIVQALIANVW